MKDNSSLSDRVSRSDEHHTLSAQLRAVAGRTSDVDDHIVIHLGADEIERLLAALRRWVLAEEMMALAESELRLDPPRISRAQRDIDAARSNARAVISKAKP